MANPEQLSILFERGVAEWNTWRQEHPDKAIDLNGAKLIFENLKRADLSNADLNEAVLQRGGPR